MIDPNSPAFPFAKSDADELPVNPGITIRQHFAAMAMQGLLAHPNTSGWTAAETATEAVKTADALICELNKP